MAECSRLEFPISVQMPYGICALEMYEAIKGKSLDEAQKILIGFEDSPDMAQAIEYLGNFDNRTMMCSDHLGWASCQAEIALANNNDIVATTNPDEPELYCQRLGW